MKRGKNILFLLLFLAMFLVVATPSLIQIRILLLKFDAMERLEKESLKIIHIAAGNINWTKKGREIRIGARLFDVKDFSRDSSGFVVTGMYDDEETNLEIQMNKLWQQQNSKHALKLLKYFRFLAVGSSQESFLSLARLSESAKLYARQINTYYKEIFIKIPYPPPQQNNHRL
ncbi:MAG: hypothetical protein ABI760_16915 [Ferruginibacter sp.]